MSYINKVDFYVCTSTTIRAIFFSFFHTSFGAYHFFTSSMFMNLSM